MRKEKNAAISSILNAQVEGTRLAFSATCMKSIVASGMSFLVCLTLLLQPVLARDARIFIPEGSEDKQPNALHAERSFDVKARLLYDSPTNLNNNQLELSGHYRVLEINSDLLFDRNVKLGVASGIGGGGSGWLVEAQGEVAGLACKGNHCFLYGSELGTDMDLTQTQQKPDPLLSTQFFAVVPGVGYLVSHNNKTFIVKVVGGGNLQAPPASPQSFVPFVDVGAQARLLIGNRFTMIAEVMQHFGLFDTRNQFKEGRLQLKWRFWHVPIDRYADRASFKGVSMQFDIRAYDGDLVTRAEYNNGQEGVIHHTTITAAGGLSIEY